METWIDDGRAQPGIPPPTLPPEILFMIFRLCLPLSWMLHGIRHLTPSSPYLADLAIKSALVLVCKSWGQVANDLLYRDVDLRSIGQLVAFTRTIEGSGGLCSIVRSLRIGFYIPRGYENLFEEQTRLILSFCPRILHFGFTPPFLIPSRNIWFPAMPTGVTSLEFTSLVDFATIRPALHALSATLRALNLAFRESADSDELYLTFPALEELHVGINVGAQPAPALMPAVWKWTTPKLTKLWLSGLVEAWEPVAALFLQGFGSNLAFLSLSLSHQASGRIRDVLEPLALRCPRLRHLVLPPFPVTHPTLSYLDFWCDSASPDFEGTFHPSAMTDLSSRVPNLLVIRLLDAAFGYMHRLPLECPPSTPGAREELEVVQYPDGRRLTFHDGADRALPGWMTTIRDFVSTASVNSQSNIDSVVGFDDSEEGDEDSGLDWTVSDCESSSGDSGDSEASDEDAYVITPAELEDLQNEGEFYIEETWEVGRNEVLNIFSGLIEA